jgi:hypothetical protein
MTNDANWRNFLTFDITDDINIVVHMGKGKAARRRYRENLKNLAVPIPWDDFIYILIHDFNADVDESTASSARTITIGQETFTVYRPHGKGRKEKFVHVSDRKKAIRALIRLNLLSED